MQNDNHANLPKANTNTARLNFSTKKTYLKLACAILIVFFTQGAALAQKTWDGGAGTSNWADNANWNPDGVPTAVDDVNLTGSSTININTNASTRNLTLSNVGLLLTILSGNSLTISGNLAITSGTMNIESSFPTVSGTVSLTGGTVGYTASAGNQTVVVRSYGSLTINGGGTKTLAGNISPSGNLTIAGGTFAMGSYTASRASAGGTFTLANGATLNIGGMNALPLNYSTHSFGATSTVIFTGNYQTISVPNSSQNYGNLVVAATGSTRLGGNVGIAGNLIVASSIFSTGPYTINRTTLGGTLTVANGATLSIGSTYSIPANYSTHSIGATSTIMYSGTTQSVAVLNSAQNYGNLTIAGSGVKTLVGNIGIAGNLSISAGTFALGSYTANRTVAGGTFTISNGATLSIGGTNTIPSNYTAHSIGVSSTISYSGANQTISVLNSSQNYGNLTISGSEIKTLSNNITVRGALAISGANLADAGFVLTANGNISNSMSHTGIGKITLAGGSLPHTLSGIGSYTNLELNDALGGTISSNMIINGTLTLTNGKITTNANMVAVSSTGNVSRVNGYVSGRLQKYIATGAISKTFEIGDASNYTPVDISFSDVSTSGLLTAATTAGDHPNIVTSTIDSVQSVNRYWTLTNNGIVFTNYDAVFNFTAGSIDIGADTDLFQVGRYSSSLWTDPVVGVRTTTSTEATDVTGFGDFIIGEDRPDPPLLAIIGSQEVFEGDSLIVNVSASDPDGDSLILSAFDLPENAVFVDSGNGTGLFNFVPAFDQAGDYNISFIASDGNLADSEIVLIQVGNFNRAPVLAEIGPQSVSEGDTLVISISASDPDGDSLILSAIDLPENAVFVDSGNGTGLLTFEPSYDQAGDYNISFIASDGDLADSEVVIIQVSNFNRAPVLAEISPQSVSEGDTLIIGISASDPDGDSLILSTFDLPENAMFVDSGNGTGLFTFEPDYDQAGEFYISFLASDGDLADSEIVLIQVGNFNRAPALAEIGNQSVSEGDSLIVSISASDPDGGSLILSAIDLPENAVFVDSGNGTGLLTFEPSYEQAGDYNISFIASDGDLTDSEIVLIQVSNFNRAPILAEIDSQSVSEGDSLIISISASDPDGDSLILSAIDLPENTVFVDSGNGTGLLTFEPAFNQAGDFNITIIASDGDLVDSEVVLIQVSNFNRAPVLAEIGNQSVSEGDTLVIGISASDPDGDSLILSAIDLPENAVFIDSGNGSGLLTSVPDYDQSGEFYISILASDGDFADSEVVLIQVSNFNRAPILAEIGPQSVSEGDSLVIGISASDPDGDSLILSAIDLPENAVFIDSGNGTGLFTFVPEYDQAGDYNISFIASDGDLADSEVVLIQVGNFNRAPILDVVNSHLVIEGDTLAFYVYATDPDNDNLIISAVNSPENTGLVDYGNGTYLYTFIPAFDQAGAYEIMFIVSDSGLSDSELVSIEVADFNRAPILSPIGSQSLAEADTLSLNIYATDSDGDSLILSISNLPANSAFIDSGNGSGQFSFYPDFDQSGIYYVSFVASAGNLSDSESVMIRVADFNRMPEIASIESQFVYEGDTLAVSIKANDPDGDSLRLSAIALPPNTVLFDSCNGSGELIFAPDFSQSGDHSITILVSDGSLIDSETVSIEVANVNRPPCAFSLVSPAPGDTIQSNTFSLFWHSSLDLDDGDTVVYRILLDTTANPVMVFDSSSSDTTYQIANLPVSRQYYWTIIAIDRDSAFSYASDTSYFFMNFDNSIGASPVIPSEYCLEPNYPNPFNSITIIKFSLPKPSLVYIEIYDIEGREIGSPLHQEMPAGYHQIRWESNNLPSGIYFYRIIAGDFSETRKMLLLK